MSGLLQKHSLPAVIKLLATGVFLGLFVGQVMSQKNTAAVKGRIVEADGKPAVGVTLLFKRLKRAMLTDDNGSFIFQHLPATEDTLLVSSVASKSLAQVVLPRENETVDVGTLQLQYNVRQLESVEIIGRTSKSYKSDYSFFSSKTETPSLNIPQSISSITKELIADKMQLTLKDAVDEVAGVNQYSGYDEYTIRGFRAENARDINGLRGYNTTYVSLLLVNIERIEVIKGPTATLYGNCDPGGTINLVTKKPLEKQGAEINIYGGKWNHFRAEGDVTGPLNKSKTLLYRFNAGYDDRKSFRNNVTAKSYQIAPSFSFVPNDRLKMNIDFSLSNVNSVLDRGQPGFGGETSLKATPVSLSLVQKGDYLRETNIASNVTLSYKLSSRLSFNSGYLNYHTNQEVANHGIHNYLAPDSVSLSYTTWHYPTNTNTLTNYFTYKVNGSKAAHELLLGYDYIKSATGLKQRYYELPGLFGEGSGIVGTFSLRYPSYPVRTTSAYQPSGFDQEATDVDAEMYRTQGIYLQDQVSLNKWKFLFSLREEFYKSGGDDDNDDSGGLIENVFLPRIGIVYSLKPNLSLYATYNKGFDPFEASTATQVFEAPFKPVTSQLWEAGAKANFFRNNLSASLAVYQLTLHNVAVNANDAGNPNLFVQQGENRSRGVEAEATGNIMSNLSVYITYAFSECKVRESKIASQVGTLAENAPRHTSGTYIKYTLSKGAVKGLAVSVGHSSVSERNTLHPDIQLPGYIIFNAGLQYNYRHFKIGAILNNVTNKIYWTGAYNNTYKWPGEPISMMVNFGYRF